MSSTTAAKKEIIDYLWDWAETHGDWAKLLVNFVVTTEKELSEEDRQLVFNYFLEALRPVQSRKLPALRISKPLYAPTSNVIELVSLQNITGVNRLAKGQVMRFHRNVTVVYGENGTGKTGYGRILKCLGFSYDPKNVIHPNISGTKERKSATIEYTLNGVANSFVWDGQNANNDLSNISVFNNNCVQISLADRQLIVSPIGFHLFGLVTTTLMALGRLLQDKIALHGTEVGWLPGLHEGTPQARFLNAMDAKCTEEQLLALAKCPDNVEEILAEKKASLANLNADLMNTRLAALNAQLRELVDIEKKIGLAQSLLSAERIKALAALNAQILALDSKTQLGLKEVAEGRGILQYESAAFKDFIRAADVYLKQLDRETYPAVGDKCLYCQQPLEQAGQELLAQYKRLLNDTTQQDKKRLTEQRKAETDLVKPVDTGLKLHQSIFGVQPDGAPVQPSELMLYNDRLTQLKLTVEQNRVTGETNTDVDYTGLLQFLGRKRVELQAAVDTLHSNLQTMQQTAATLTLAIHELEDRVFLQEKLDDAIKVLKNHKIVALLSSKTGEFNTGSLSRKTTEARDLLVRQDFDANFQRELRAMRKSELPIQLSFGTERGNSKLTQRAGSHLLAEILSEGEQKAIALAEFLTELQLDPVRAPVIFDDPVNSLDHRITDEVAKRLIRLSKTRQTVIFTHSILLLNSLFQQAELETTAQQGIGFTFYSVKNNFGETGILGEGDEPNSFSHYKSKVDAIIKGPSKGDEAKLAAEGYGHLRAAIEVTVEQDLFQKTIQRYRKGVAFPSLLRVDGTKIDQHKEELNDIYEKCCVSIDGHSSPEGVHTTPTITELKADLAAFLELRSRIKKN